MLMPPLPVMPDMTSTYTACPVRDSVCSTFIRADSLAVQQAARAGLLKVPAELQPHMRAFRAAASSRSWQLPDELAADASALILLALGGVPCLTPVHPCCWFMSWIAGKQAACQLARTCLHGLSAQHMYVAPVLVAPAATDVVEWVVSLT